MEMTIEHYSFHIVDTYITVVWIKCLGRVMVMVMVLVKLLIP